MSSVKLRLEQYTRPSRAYQAVTRQMDGKDYLVVPVTMMVEGVHNGSHGPILHLAEELGKIPASWDGIPVTISHPSEDGHSVSANSPTVLEQFSVGRIFNTHLEGYQLKAEAWLDPGRLQQISPVAFSKIKEGLTMEVSVGIFSEEDPVEGDWNNEHYISIARNYRPDHLALLPEETGACSVQDGCGIRLNQEGGTMDFKQLKDLNKQGFVVSMINNGQGYTELLNKVQAKLDAMDNDVRVYFLEELFDDYVIYRVRRREGDGNTAIYKQTYQVNEDQSIDFTGDPVEVRKEVSYVTMGEVTMKRLKTNKKEVQTMSNEVKPCVKGRVDALIANANSKFTEDDREWLQTLEEAVLDKLVPAEPKAVEAPVTMSADEAKKVLKDTLKDPKQYMELLPEDVRESVAVGLKLHNDNKVKMIQGIIANTAEGVWDEDTLKKMDYDTLSKISKSVVKETEQVVDYSVTNVRTNTGGGKVIPLMLPEDKKPN